MLLGALPACRGPAVGSTPTDEGTTEAAVVIDEGPGWPSWGPRVPAVAPPGVLAAELARDPRAPELRALLDEAGDVRERVLWSLARIGGRARAAVLLAALDEADAVALAAAALLEAPRASVGAPAEPSDSEPWAALEDAL